MPTSMNPTTPKSKSDGPRRGQRDYRQDRRPEGRILLPKALRERLSLHPGHASLRPIFDDEITEASEIPRIQSRQD